MKLSVNRIDYEQHIQLAGDNARDGQARRRFAIEFPREIEDSEVLAATIAKLRAFATWLELQKART